MTEEEKRRNMLAKLNSGAEPSTEIVPAEERDVAKEELDADYNYTRDRLKTLVDVGESAIDHLKEIAEESGETRAFDVLATLLKNTGDLAKGVMNNASNKVHIDNRREQNKNSKPDGEKDPATVNNTTIFVGTTKDLLDKISNEELERKTIDATVVEEEK